VANFATANQSSTGAWIAQNASLNHWSGQRNFCPQKDIPRTEVTVKQIEARNAP
jgi:hypothetical protein